MLTIVVMTLKSIFTLRSHVTLIRYPYLTIIPPPLNLRRGIIPILPDSKAKEAEVK